MFVDTWGGFRCVVCVFIGKDYGCVPGNEKMTALGVDQSGDHTNEIVVHVPNVVKDSGRRSHDNDGKRISLVQG